MLPDLLTAITIGFFLSFVMGPVFFVLLETSITKGFKAAIILNLGVVFADICFISLCYFSSRQLIDNFENKPGLFVLGGTILLVYGVFIFLTRKKAEIKINIEEDSENYKALFLKGFFLNIINVGVLLFWGGVFAATVPTLHSKDSFTILAFLATILASYFVTDLGKIVIAKRLKPYLNTNNIITVKIILGIIISIFGLYLILKGSEQI